MCKGKSLLVRRYKVTNLIFMKQGPTDIHCAGVSIELISLFLEEPELFCPIDQIIPWCASTWFFPWSSTVYFKSSFFLLLFPSYRSTTPKNWLTFFKKYKFAEDLILLGTQCSPATAGCVRTVPSATVPVGLAQHSILALPEQGWPGPKM